MGHLNGFRSSQSYVFRSPPDPAHPLCGSLISLQLFSVFVTSVCAAGICPEPSALSPQGRNAPSPRRPSGEWDSYGDPRRRPRQEEKFPSVLSKAALRRVPASSGQRYSRPSCPPRISSDAPQGFPGLCQRLPCCNRADGSLREAGRSSRARPRAPRPESARQGCWEWTVGSGTVTPRP